MATFVADDYLGAPSYDVWSLSSSSAMPWKSLIHQATEGNWFVGAEQLFDGRALANVLPIGAAVLVGRNLRHNKSVAAHFANPSLP